MASPLPTSTTPQETFTSHHDPSNPPESITSYARQMHQHTKRQMDLATRSSRRSPADQGVSSHGQLAPEGSIDSVDSLQR